MPREFPQTVRPLLCRYRDASNWRLRILDSPYQWGNPAISDEEQQYADGQYPRLLDIVDVPLLEPAAKHHQSENWLIAPGRWRKVGTLDWSDLAQLEGSAAPLWINGYGWQYNTQDGNNNRMPSSLAHMQRDSLRLIRVDALEIVVPSGSYYRRKMQGHFCYGDDPYSLRVTDPEYELKYRKRPPNSYSLGECFVTVSLTESFEDGRCYKLIAGIMEK